MLEGKKVVLAYSGGLDTSVCVKWLEQQGAEPYALYLDLGQGEPSEDVKANALEIGATDAFVRDARAQFASEYVAPAIMANALYGGKYPLFTALGRPLIAKKLVETAREVGATHIAHGSTGKGNDQVRFDVTTASIAPDLTVVAPVRDWNMSRPEEMAYAEEHGIPVVADCAHWVASTRRSMCSPRCRQHAGQASSVSTSISSSAGPGNPVRAGNGI